jgi:hypothetical protein
VESELEKGTTVTFTLPTVSGREEGSVDEGSRENMTRIPRTGVALEERT